MNHVEGGWPKEVDYTEAEHVIRYRKKVQQVAAMHFMETSIKFVACRSTLLVPYFLLHDMSLHLLLHYSCKGKNTCDGSSSRLHHHVTQCIMYGTPCTLFAGLLQHQQLQPRSYSCGLHACAVNAVCKLQSPRPSSCRGNKPCH